MSNKIPVVKSVLVAAMLAVSVSGIAHADTTIPVRQYQAWSSDSSAWQLNAPVFDKTPATFHQSNPHGLPVRQYQALSDDSTEYQLNAPVFDKTPSTFHQSNPHGLPVSQYQAWADDMHQWQLPNQSKTSALASTDEAVVTKNAANEPFGARIAKLFHVSPVDGATSAN